MKLLLLTTLLLFPLNPLSESTISTTIEDYYIYSTNYEIGGTSQIGNQMISKYFDDEIKLVKEDELYFLSITLLDNNALSSLNISLPSTNLKSGIEEEINGQKSTFTITLSYKDLLNELKLSGSVAKMGMNVSFTIKPNLDNLIKSENKVDANKEYPARFVPILNIDEVGNIETTLNSYYKLPSATASFNDFNLEVSTKVTSPSGKNVLIENNKIYVDELGDYTIDFKASTGEYKTNLGNDSYTKKTIILTSNAKESNMVKINDINNILPNNYTLQCQRIESGVTYDKISNLINSISSSFEITNLNIIDSNGESVTLSNNIECFIEANPNYDRNKVKVYYINKDNLENINCEGYGRYIKFQNNKLGNYLILIEDANTKLNLPLVLSLLIIVGLIIIALIIFLIIFIIKKKKKQMIA